MFFGDNPRPHPESRVQLQQQNQQLLQLGVNPADIDMNNKKDRKKLQKLIEQQQRHQASLTAPASSKPKLGWGNERLHGKPLIGFRRKRR